MAMGVALVDDWRLASSNAGPPLPHLDSQGRGLFGDLGFLHTGISYLKLSFENCIHSPISPNSPHSRPNTRESIIALAERCRAIVFLGEAWQGLVDGGSKTVVGGIVDF